jgi:6-phosphogluconolactonase (cycloisomerase 2 family)
MAAVAASVAGRLALAAESPAPAPPRFAYVGCNTAREYDGHGKGISVYRIDPESRAWSQIQLIEALNPAFLVLDHRQDFLYAAHGNATYVTAYAVDRQSGQLTYLNQQPTGGRNAIHLAVDPGNRFLLAANYTSGNVSVFPIDARGALQTVAQSIALSGKPGPHRDQQPGSHPHEIVFDRTGRFVAVPDKGLDKIFVFRFDSAGKLIPADPPFVTTRAGAGPRHMAFHPNGHNAYVINQLDSTVTAYAYDAGRGTLRPLQIVPTLPTTYTGDNDGAEILISPSGKFVYASNRGMDTIGILEVNAATGVLTPVAWQPTEGKTPRFMAMSSLGDCLYAANQQSDSIVPFAVDPATGRLSSTGPVVKTGSPCCIAFR